MTQTLALPISVLPGSRTLPAGLADVVASRGGWARLVPFASSIAAQERLTAPEELAGGSVKADVVADALAEKGALRFLVATVDVDHQDELAWPAADLKSYLEVMETCGQLRAEVNQDLAQRNIACRVRFYAPVPVSRALTYGTLSHAAAVAYDRIKQAADAGGWSVSELGIRLEYRQGDRALEVSVLSPPPQKSRLVLQAIPVFASEGGLPHSVQALAASLMAVGAQVVDCDASTSPILVDFVKHRGKELDVLLNGLRNLSAGVDGKRP